MKGKVSDRSAERRHYAELLARFKAPMASVEERKAAGKALRAQVLGADRPVSTMTPLFLRRIPIEKAMHPDTLLATHMNGEPLPLLHGAPLRLIAPGWPLTIMIAVLVSVLGLYAHWSIFSP